MKQLGFALIILGLVGAVGCLWAGFAGYLGKEPAMVSVLAFLLAAALGEVMRRRP